MTVGMTLCGLYFRNPVLTASGTYGYGIEFEKQIDLNSLGGIVTKGLSIEPIRGNPAPRLWEATAGMINSVGLQNIGVRHFVAEKLPLLNHFSTNIVVNVFGYQTEQYEDVVRVLNDADGIAAYELNVSCPNTKHGGLAFGVDEAALSDLVSRVKTISKRPVIVKLSPNVTSIQPFARVAESSGADAISLVNTFVSLAIDARARQPRVGAGFGGLSGPAIKPIALRMVHEVYRTVKLPVIGIGGINSGEDVAEFLIAGASLVQVGTASFIDPTAPVRIARELEALLPELGVTSAEQLVGTLKMP
ncbi:MAG TPA: dihydroorotate dehydrogenase [Bryobacteraceae bacterium]|nr:dihydroorotate dehydrogenase [Bryobacteraceae bacterium]